MSEQSRQSKRQSVEKEAAEGLRQPQTIRPVELSPEDVAELQPALYKPAQFVGPSPERGSPDIRSLAERIERALRCVHDPSHQWDFTDDTRGDRKRQAEHFFEAMKQTPNMPKVWLSVEARTSWLCSVLTEALGGKE